MLKTDRTWEGQEGYLERGVSCLQSTHNHLKALTPLLLPVNGILESLEGKAGLEGQIGGLSKH